MRPQTRSLAVCGNNLAANMAALRLADGLGPDWDIIQLSHPDLNGDDRLYGQVTDPDSYNFLRSLGLDEAALFLSTSTSFSYGTHFREWLGRSWVQCHHAPLPTIASIPLRHFLARSGLRLEPYLVSAQAALAGRFAHPPKDPAVALSRAEYGYQFSPPEWSALLDSKIAASRIQTMQAPVSAIATGQNRITTLELANGEKIDVDLVIDAGGQDRRFITAAGASFGARGAINVKSSKAGQSEIGPPCREIRSEPDGWTGSAFLQDARHDLHIGQANANQEGAARLGTLSEAWVGNCIAIGQAASVIEPLTPAPMIMLRRDIERLMELIPVSPDMDVERGEFNRRFREDYQHLKIFDSALREPDKAPDTPYWQSHCVEPMDKKLHRKLRQFRNRGILARYDLEPFNDEDWTIAHLGMERRPEKYDRQVDRVLAAESEQALNQIRQSIQLLLPKMPPHGAYISRLKQYLERQGHE